MSLLTSKLIIAIDGIYFNPVEGEAGTSWPVGTPEHPVNNLADAITLMFARNLKKLYLAGARTFTGTHTAANDPTVMTDANNTFKPSSLVGLTIYNDDDGSSGVITANGEHTIEVAALVGGGANIWTTGDDYHVADALGYQPYLITFDQNVELELVGNGLYDVIVNPGITVTFTNGLVCRAFFNTTGNINIFGHCQVRGNLSNTTGIIFITGDCKVGYDLNNTTGNINIFGHCQVGGDISQTDTGNITITGDCRVGNDLGNTTGNINIFGHCQVGGNLSNTTGDINIVGDCKVGGDISQTDTGTIAIGGDCEVVGDLSNTTGDIGVAGDCKVGHDLSNTTGTIFIAGDCKAGRDLLNTTGDIGIGGDCEVVGDLSNTTGTIKFYGNCQIGGNLDNEGSISHCNIRFMRASATMDLLLSATSLISRVISRGLLTVSQMVAGATATIDLCGGILTIAASCTGGTIDLYGDCAVNDLAGGAVTVNDHRIPGHS